MQPAQLLRVTQRTWATSAGIGFDAKGYCGRAEENLPWLTDAIRAEFDAADGQEFGRQGKPGKAMALHSSSALAVNVFSYWKDRLPAPPLATALGVDSITKIRFEQRYPTGIGPKAPNIDVVLTLATAPDLAIESKFCETFGARKKTGIQDKYFPEGREVWSAVGLVGAQRAAAAERNGSNFRLLDAPQLLKHMLGLATVGRPWHLLLLWFAPTEAIAVQMASEAQEFRTLLGLDADRFSAMTYQELWTRMGPALGREDVSYAEYLEARYFKSAAGPSRSAIP